MRRVGPAVKLPVILAAAAAVVAPPLWTQRPQQPRPVFRAGVELVVLNISVVDDDGEPVTGLTIDDFRVFEDGRRQELTLFATSEDTPLDVALVLDVSGSIAMSAPTVKEDAKSFLEALGPRDCVYLLPFRDAVGTGMWAAPDDRSLNTLIDQVELSGGTALYDALRKALTTVDRARYTTLPGEMAADIGEYDGDFCGVALPPPSTSRPGSVRRTAIVVLSDGGDEHSIATYADTLISAWSSPVPIFSVAVGEALPPRRNRVGVFGAGQRRYRRLLAYSEALENRLGQLAGVTGGELILGRGRDAVRESFEEVVTMLRSSYLVGYNAPEDEGTALLSWHELEVELSDVDAEARTRPGYYRSLADTEGAARIVQESPALIRQRQPEEALRQLDLAIQLDPSYWPIYLQRARALRALGRDAAAREALETVLYLNPGLGGAHALLAEVTYLLGDLQVAWYHAVRAVHDGMDMRDFMRELIALSGIPEGLEQQLRAPRVFVDSAPTPEELDQGTLVELLRALRLELSGADDVGLISQSSVANFGIFLEVEKIEENPRKLKGKLIVNGSPYDAMHDEGVEIADVDDPAAVARGIGIAVDKVREWIAEVLAER